MAWTQVDINIIDGGHMNKNSYIYIFKYMMDKWPSYLHFRKLNRVKNFFAKKCLRQWNGEINFGTRLRISTDISVGYDVGIGDCSRINGPTTLGNHVMIAPNVAIYRSNHGMALDKPMSQQPMTKSVELLVEDDVWLGDGAIILPGCTKIGKGSIIGARAVVTHDIPEYSIVVGNPCKIIKRRT